MASTNPELEFIIRPRRGAYIPGEGSPQSSCCLVEARLLAGDRYLAGIPCFSCSGCSTFDTYFEFAQQKFSESLLSKLRSLNPSFLEQVASNFANFVRGLNAKSLCPHLGAGTTHVLEIIIRRVSMTTIAARALRIAFEEADPVMRPASVKSVEELVEARSIKMTQEGDRFETGWNPVDCIICIEQIEKRTDALSMPCNHLFHDDCLRQWLKNSNVCPLCRYKLC